MSQNDKVIPDAPAIEDIEIPSSVRERYYAAIGAYNRLIKNRTSLGRELTALGVWSDSKRPLHLIFATLMDHGAIIQDLHTTIKSIQDRLKK